MHVHIHQYPCELCMWQCWDGIDETASSCSDTSHSVISILPEHYMIIYTGSHSTACNSCVRLYILTAIVVRFKKWVNPNIYSVLNDIQTGTLCLFIKSNLKQAGTTVSVSLLGWDRAREKNIWALNENKNNPNLTSPSIFPLVMDHNISIPYLIQTQLHVQWGTTSNHLNPHRT